MWVWIAIGVGSLILVSLLVGFAFARALGAMARDAAALYEDDFWSSLPPTRMPDQVEQVPPDEAVATRSAAR